VSHGDASLNSAVENEDTLRQRYSITMHPSLPIFLCSDGYLLCILKLESAFSTQSRLMRELMHKTIGLLNSSSKLITKSDSEIKNPLKQLDTKQNDDNLPDWGLQTVQELIQSEKSSDSELENVKVDARPRSSSTNTKIAEGKIIFSYLPQVMPISEETFHTDNLVNKMEAAFEYLQSSWTLLLSTNTLEAAKNTHECDQTAKAIQQAFSHFSYLFLMIDSENIKEFQIYKNEFQDGLNEKEFKLQVLVDLFIKMLKLLNFDPASKYNPNSHMIIYVPVFVEKFTQALIRFDNTISLNDSRSNLLGLIYMLLNTCEKIMKSIYSLKNNKTFIINQDAILAQKSLISSFFEKNQSEDSKLILEETRNNTVEFEISILRNNSFAIPVQTKPNHYESIEFVDFLFEKCWSDLIHNARKYRDKLEMLGSMRQKQLKDLDILIILIERRLEQLPAVFNLSHAIQQARYSSIQSRKQIFEINRADFVYLASGDVDAAIDEWIIQLNDLFLKLKSKKNRLIYNKKDVSKSIKIAHKIFYACLTNYRLKKLLQFINMYFVEEASDEFSPFNLMKNNFKHVKPPKPLQKTHIAIVSIIKSLARFMALYFADKPLLINSVSNPDMMPCLIDQTNSSTSISQSELSKQKLIDCINNQKEVYVQSKFFSHSNFEQIDLIGFFSADKALELFVLTGLYDEALFFMNTINDWKNSYLITSILKESENVQILNMIERLPDKMQPENLLSSKLCSFFGIEKLETNNLKLMDKQELDSIGLILKELILCSVMTRTNILEPLLTQMMQSFVFYTNQLCFNNIIVSEEFYLPAPPIYCLQMDTNEQKINTDLLHFHTESNLRAKLYSISKCIIILFSSSNLHVPLIKWYIEYLLNSSKEMKQKFGINNSFQLNNSLKNLLTSIRYQKLGYIPEHILQMFRDFCSILFFLDIRDKFTHTLRQYSRHFILNQDDNYAENKSKKVLNMCLKIIDYGCLLLSYKSFVKFQHDEIQDIVLSTVTRLTKFNQYLLLKDFNLEQKLVNCVLKHPFKEIYQMGNTNDEYNSNKEEFELKLKVLYDSWTRIPTSQDHTGQISMADVYEHTLLVNEQANKKLITIYGIGEDCLYDIYVMKQQRSQPSIPGGYDFERSEYCGEFLELFFKLAFDQSEDWDSLIQSVNQTPLLPEFYDVIRSEQSLSCEFVDKQFIIMPLSSESHTDLDQLKEINSAKKSSRRRRSFLLESDKVNKVQLVSEEPENQLEKITYQQRGLFRSYSIMSLDLKSAIHDEIIKKKRSASVSNLNENSDEIQPFKVQKKNNEQLRTEKPLKVIDYGYKYVQISNLAIWLIKWAMRFQKLSMKHKVSGSFWQDSESHSQSLKLNTINANFLAGCFYFSDNNNLDFTSRTVFKKPKTRKPPAETSSKPARKDYDDEFTQISTSYSLLGKRGSLKHPMDTLTVCNQAITNKEQYEDEEASVSTSIDVSSLTDNQIKTSVAPTDNQIKTSVTPTGQSREKQHNMKPKSRSKSPLKQSAVSLNQSLNSSQFSLGTQEVSEFYHLKDPKLAVKPPFSTQLSQQSNTNKEDLNKSFEKKSLLASIELLTYSSNNNSNKNSRNTSPVLPRSPTKSPTPGITQRINNQLLRSQEISESKISPQFSSSPMNPTSNDIKNLMKSELMRIFQIQHETVMNFLNAGSGNAHMEPHKQLPIQTNIEHQLNTIFNQQQQVKKNTTDGPVEFIIETKVKAIDPLNGQPKTVSSISTANLQNDKENYFLKTFDLKPTASNKPSTSDLIKIPLLSSQMNESYTELDSARSLNVHLPVIEQNLAENKQSGFKLLDFKSLKNKNKVNLLHLEQKNNVEINRHIKTFVDNSKKIKSYDKNFPLLKLNYITDETNKDQMDNSRLETIQPAVRKRSLEPKVNDSNHQNIRPQQIRKTEEPVRLIDSNKKETKETQVERPNYDGYILAPGIFNDMLDKDASNRETSAQIHFKSTQHLRESEKRSNELHLRKDNYTMTESLKNADPIAPDIFFKMRFNSKRNDRETANDENDMDEILDKDYLNVVDMDGNAVNELLHLIELEQNKREVKILSTKKETNKEKKIGEETQVSLDQNEVPEAEPGRLDGGDILTENLLSSTNNKDDWKTYDEMIKRQIEDTAKEAGHSIQKQRMLNELKFIDEKMRLMDQMADHMDTDYQKYGKILTTVQDLSNQRDRVANDYQNLHDQAEKEKELTEYQSSKEKVIFYDRTQADDRISNLKQRIEYKKHDKNPRRSSLFDEDLSDLKENEELKLRKILKQNEMSMNLTGESSITNILKDVLNDFDVETVEDLDSDKLDLILEKSSKSPSRKNSHSTQLPSKTPSRRSSHSIQSSARRNSQSSSSKSPTKSRSNLVHEPPTKLSPKTSPIVNRKKQMSNKRETLQKQFSSQREQDAKALLTDILIENDEFEEEMSRRMEESGRINTPRSERKTISPSGSMRSQRHTRVPDLNLENSHLNEAKKPSLMAKTIIALERKETARKNETDRLLKDLENRAKFVTKDNNKEKKQSVKTIKPFTSYVHLQEPNKLRDRADHKAVTYGQQLIKHQETTVMPKTSADQIYKIYGTKRVPGLYKGYTKQTPRKSKTYTDTLKELKPAESQAIIRDPKKNNSNYISKRKHVLQTKTNTNVSKTQQRRFKPYKSPLNEDLEDEHIHFDDLSSWSLDENLKNIIYDKPNKTNTNNKSMKRVTYKEIDQDTMADLDADYLNDLLEDEKQNDKIYQRALKDLNQFGEDEDEYLDQVDLEDLKNISFSSESAISSFIDWDQIDQLVGTL